MKTLSGHVLRDHVILGGIVAFIGAAYWGFANSMMFWLVNILIDLDHYLHFVWLAKFKKIGFKSMFRFHEIFFSMRHHPDFIAVEIFHTAEFMFLLAIFTVLFPQVLLPIFLGCLFHMVVDFFHLLRFRIFTKRAHSFVEYFLRKKRIRERGGDPNALAASCLENE
jgi:hypothetical protein